MLWCFGFCFSPTNWNYRGKTKSTLLKKWAKVKHFRKQPRPIERYQFQFLALTRKYVNQFQYHPKVPDPRLGYFSNNPDEGLMYQGTEGWHVDGNTVELPHTFTIIHCIAANSNGPTLLVPLREIVERLSSEERDLLDKIVFVSAFNQSIQHPLLYKHPYRHDDTIMLALGSLSGNYLLKQDNEPVKTLSKDETQHIQDILEAKILGSNLIYTHQWQKGDLLVLNNPSLAHIAGPGSQGSHEVTGLRLMHRSTVAGKVKPSKLPSQAAIPLQYHCFNHPPFDSMPGGLLPLFPQRISVLSTVWRVWNHWGTTKKMPKCSLASWPGISAQWDLERGSWKNCFVSWSASFY